MLSTEIPSTLKESAPFSDLSPLQEAMWSTLLNTESLACGMEKKNRVELVRVCQHVFLLVWVWGLPVHRELVALLLRHAWSSEALARSPPSSLHSISLEEQQADYAEENEFVDISSMPTLSHGLPSPVSSCVRPSGSGVVLHSQNSVSEAKILQKHEEENDLKMYAQVVLRAVGKLCSRYTEDMARFIPAMHDGRGDSDGSSEVVGLRVEHVSKAVALEVEEYRFNPSSAPSCPVDVLSLVAPRKKADTGSSTKGTQSLCSSTEGCVHVGNDQHDLKMLVDVSFKILKNAEEKIHQSSFPSLLPPALLPNHYARTHQWTASTAPHMKKHGRNSLGQPCKEILVEDEPTDFEPAADPSFRPMKKKAKKNEISKEVSLFARVSEPIVIVTDDD